MRFLFRPVAPFHINQPFGENKACVDIATGKRTITCDGLNPPKGYRSLYSRMKGHSGVDLMARRGQSIFSSQDGVVSEVVSEEARGLGLGIITKKKFYCEETGKNEYFKIRYWHNLIHLVKEGDEVKLGQSIALADNTGYSSGNHLHFELKPVRVTWRKGKPTRISNILQRNGFFGAVNPLQYTHEYDASIFRQAKSMFERLIALLKLM